MSAAATTRVERITQAVEQSDYDAVIALGYASFQYFSGYWYQYGRSFYYRPSIVVWPKSGDPVILVGRDQTKGPERDSWIKDVRAYDQVGRRPPGGVTEALAALLREMGLDGSRIGIEFQMASATLVDEIKTMLPDVELSPCDEWMDLLRAVKSPSEVAIMRRCAAAVEGGLAAAFRRAEPGWTEKNLHDAISDEILQRGASGILLITVQSGAAASGFYPTSDAVMEGFVRTDATGVLDGYFADMARMAFIGEPTPEQDATYRAQRELNDRIIDSMRVGNTCADVYARCVAEAAAMGLDLVPQPSIGLGHTIGLNSQDFPTLKDAEPEPLAPGMIFAIEPDTFGPNGELVHQEEMILITDDGPDVITSTEDWNVMPRIT